MNETTTPSGAPAQRTAPGLKIIALAAIIFLFFMAGFLAYQAWSGRQSTASPGIPVDSAPGEPANEAGQAGQAEASAVTQTITAAELEENYGLRVRLLAVTAGGGMIDLRLKVIDPEKAAQLLGPGEELPRLVIPGRDVTLQAPPVDQGIELEDGTIIFGLYPNSQHAIDPGSPVSVQFGSLLLEPVIAQ